MFLNLIIKFWDNSEHQSSVFMDSNQQHQHSAFFPYKTTSSSSPPSSVPPIFSTKSNAVELMDVGMSISSDVASGGTSMTMIEYGEKFIENVYTMSLRIPAFGLLSYEDQLRLLENGWVELFLIGLIETSSVAILSNENMVETITDDMDKTTNNSESSSEETEGLRVKRRLSNDINEEAAASEMCKIVFLRRLQAEVERMRELNFKPRELDHLRGLILFNPSKRSFKFVN